MKISIQYNKNMLPLVDGVYGRLPHEEKNITRDDLLPTLSGYTSQIPVPYVCTIVITNAIYSINIVFVNTW